MATTHLPHSDSQLDLSALKGVIPLVGLTGGIGSGKNAVSDLLAKLGAGIIDSDLIAHQITASGGSAIASIEKVFGPEFIDPNGALNRGQMRALVFEKPAARQLLEQITHPLIKEGLIEQAVALAKTPVPYLVFVVPLLAESTFWQQQMDHLVVVDCPLETQIERVMHRNKLGKLEVENIIQAQASREQRLSIANTVIKNQSTLEQLNTQVLQLHHKLLKIGEDIGSSS
jgi:dephospho-CoA kinase